MTCGSRKTRHIASDASLPDVRAVVLAPLREWSGTRVFRVLPRTEFKWSSVAKGGSLAFQSPRYAPVDSMEEALAVIRVHRAAGSGGGDVEFVVHEVAFSSDEPESVFSWPLTAMTVRVSPGDSGISVAQRLRLDLARHLRLVVTFHRGDVAGASTGAYSLDLVMRRGSAEQPGKHCNCDAAGDA